MMSIITDGLPTTGVRTTLKIKLYDVLVKRAREKKKLDRRKMKNFKIKDFYDTVTNSGNLKKTLKCSKEFFF